MHFLINSVGVSPTVLEKRKFQLDSVNSQKSWHCYLITVSFIQLFVLSFSDKILETEQEVDQLNAEIATIIK